MTLTVQDDTGQVAGANAYINAAFFISYHTDRGVDVDLFDEDEQINPAIILATDYADSKYAEQYIGSRKISGAIRQTTQWPRDAAYDRDGYDVSDSIPDVLMQVIAEYAKEAINPDGGVDSLTETFEDSKDRSIKLIKEKVDVLETITEYHNNGQASSTKDFPKPDLMIKSLLKFSVSNNQILRA